MDVLALRQEVGGVDVGDQPHLPHGAAGGVEQVDVVLDECSEFEPFLLGEAARHQFVRAEPVFDADTMYVNDEGLTAYDMTDIQLEERNKENVPAYRKTDTYPDKKYEGRISFIASQAEFTPKNVQTEKERVKLVYRIKVDLTNPNLELKPGMPADAEILLTSAVASHAGNTN